MPKLTIDNQAVDVPAGATLLEAAEHLDIEIPTLCHVPGRDALTSCMVCIVKLCAPGAERFVPACGTPAGEGMVVESETDEVHALRREALELLLGDHLGDCEAPCRLAHPRLLDIPRMLRKVADGNVDAARDILQSADPGPGNAGKAPPFERACRRGRIDQPVAIEAVLAYLRDTSNAQPNSPDDAAKPARPFSVHMGALEEEELAEFLRTADDSPRHDGPLDVDSAQAEAKRCLHCDCRKPTTCRLRIWADRYEATPRKYFQKHRPFRLIDQHAEIFYEPGKCIQCGLCVQIASEAREELGLSFIGRGFDVHVAVPMHATLAEGLRRVARACADACPTAALVRRDADESAWGSPDS